jgi:CDP-diacylglycerol--inositol 3-phosphatidyltransferase
MRDDVPRLLYLYYTNRVVLGLVCLGNELFYVFLYVLYFARDLVQQYPAIASYTGSDFESMVVVAIYCCFPVFALKQIINVIQMVRASNDIVQWDYETTYARKS